MMRFDFSYDEYQRLLERCPFSDEEIKIFELKRRGKTNIAICCELCISEATLSRRLHKMTNKIMKEI